MENQFATDSGEWDLVFTEIRVAEHDRFGRNILEFSRTGRAGWPVNYVDQARLDGSGRAVTLGGDSTLTIFASDTTAPVPGYHSGHRIDPENGGDINDGYAAGTIEGYTQVLAGIDGDRVPFRVIALSDPLRLVVDVDDDHSD